MGFLQIARTSDITNGQMKSFTVEGKEILIINSDGKYYAINGRCTHMGGEFIKGKIEGKIITCPRHGAKFDITTGKCISGPKIGILKLKTKDEVTYEVKIENESINVNF